MGDGTDAQFLPRLWYIFTSYVMAKGMFFTYLVMACGIFQKFIIGFNQIITCYCLSVQPNVIVHKLLSYLGHG